MFGFTDIQDETIAYVTWLDQQVYEDNYSPHPPVCEQSRQAMLNAGYAIAMAAINGLLLYETFPDNPDYEQGMLDSLDNGAAWFALATQLADQCR